MKYLLVGQESKRLIFRKLLETDFDWWMGFCENPDAIRYFDFTGDLIPQDFCRLWFDKVFERYANNSGGHNVLIEKETGERVGMCGLLVQEVDGVDEFEIGYSIHPGFWRQGLASEAAQKCKEFAFKNNFAGSLISIVHIDNEASARVAKNNGMVLDKTTVYKEISVNIFRILKGS